MKTREEIITGMCHTYRHDYGLLKNDEDVIQMTSGVTRSQQEVIWNTMAQIFDNSIVPYMEYKS